ncbi:hypothetical protein DL96DRAFT_1580026 [Flagelloscypha sp. PMI_526]|nr:hypothetical protein DL96DRAFT_1580026 [Flagelloscypha sp. PMI_526]
MSLFGEQFSVKAFPASLRYLDVCFSGFHPQSWDNTCSIPSSSHIKILQVTALINFQVSMIEHISLSQFTSLKYLRLHSNFRDGGSVEFNNWLVTEIIPQFSDTLRVCVLFDRVYTGFGNRTISREMRALIMGAVDDRIIISTDQRIRLSPRGMLEEFLVRWEHYDGSHRIVSPLPIFSDTFGGKVGGVPSWEDLDRLVDRRRAIRQKWLQMYPTGVANVEVCRIVDYPFRRTAFEQAREVVLFVPGVIIWGGQALWRRLKPLTPRRFIRALTINH